MSTKIKQPFSRVAVENHMNVILGQGTVIVWTLDSRFVEPAPYLFRVYRGRAYNDPQFVPIMPYTPDTTLAFDTEKNLGDGLNIDIWYKVKLVTADKRVYWSDPVHAVSYWNRRDWLLAQEMIRKELLRFKSQVGIRGVLLKPRVWGEPCPCVDQNTQEVTDPSCDICYGTGVISGYYPPMRYWCSRQPEKRFTRVDASMGLIQAVSSTFRGLAYPYIQPNDVIVNQDADIRWRVGKAIQVIADFRGIPIALSFPVQQIPLTEPVYRINVGAVTDE